MVMLTSLLKNSKMVKRLYMSIMEKSIFRKDKILMMERIISNYSSGNQQHPFYGV